MSNVAAETLKLYYDDCYAKTFSAKIISVTEAKGGFDIVLDKTLFYPEGGGQPFDTGRIGGANVLEVHERGGVIYHSVDKPVIDKPVHESADVVDCEIDWPRRFSIMQHHTGEHILSGVLNSLFGLSNVGFHMGLDYTAIDTDREISAGDLELAEKTANRAIYENIKITAGFPPPETLAAMKYRSKKEIEGDVRIVTIKDYDSCACCGLHCSAAGEVGVIKIINSHKYKSGTRIYMLCGDKALADYTAKNKAAYALSELLSAKPSETVQGVKSVLAENAALKFTVEEYKMKLFSLMAEKTACGTKYECLFMDGLSPDDLRRFSGILSERAEIAAVFSGGELDGYKYALCSKTADMKALATLINVEFSGKGGGRRELAQGTVYAEAEAVRSFISAKIFTGGDFNFE